MRPPPNVSSSAPLSYGFPGGGRSGAEGAVTLRISRQKGSFLKPPHVRRFCKRRVLFCTQVRSMGGENPRTIHEIYAALTPSDFRNVTRASEFAAATCCRWTGKLNYVFPFIQCQCFEKRRGVYLLEKVSVFIKIRVLFWLEISALGAF